MLIDHSEPNELYQERLRRAAEARLARQLRHRSGRPDQIGLLRRSAGNLVITFGLRMRGDSPPAPHSITHGAA